jgi:RNA polymerase sigma-70 factor (ECF subfamily)
MSADFKTEVVALLPRLRRLARAKTATAEEADDLVQATCERSWKARHQWQPGTRLDYWMFKIMMNIRIDQIRSAALQGVALGDELLDSIPDHRWSRQMEAGLTLDKVLDLMQQLPRPMREVLALVAIDGVSYKEAAEILELPLGTVMSRLARARTELMHRLGFETDGAEVALL